MASKKVDNTRDLAPMTDPIAYRESYSENDIIKNPSDLIIYQEWKPINLWWETAGSTVSQNTQNATQNQNGTSGKYDWTDGKGNITVWPQNANLNYYQYWDDSNPNQQWQKGWMNEKYTWEWVSNSYIEYNPDITLADLDPNYLYWENARQQNRREAGYIARRNDQIASALYNEWKVSREEVANFLSQQNEWMNSTEADRLNTIESVWKRLWQIKPEQPQSDLSKAEDIVQDTSGKLYWKNTAEEWNPKEWIDTLADKNSVLTAMQESRVTTLQDFVSQDVSNIAVQIVEWTMTWSEQTWRDAQKYYPEYIAAVNAEVKRQRWQQNVNAIASGGEMNTAAANWQSNANNEIANFWVNNATWTKSSVEITKDVHNSLAQNQTANEASETMASIEEDMAILKNRLKNLREEANSKFKWDVPEYMVNAYISNKTQEIQNQMQILEDRYNAAYNRYKTEIAQTQWEKEYQLKQDQLQLQRDELDYKKWATEQQINASKEKNSSNPSDTSATNEWDTYEVTTLSDEQVSQAVDTLWDMYDNWQLGNAQCAAWIQRYYLPMLWITLPNLSSIENKTKLVNEDSEYTPKRWDLIILKSKSAPKNWHIGIVLNVLKDWTIEYMDWNGSLWADGKWTEKVWVHGINPSSNSIIWFRNVNKGQWQATNTDNKQFTDGEYEAFEKYLSSDLSKNDQTQLESRYWFKDDPEWMTNFAREALDNRDTADLGGQQTTAPINVPEWSTVSTNAQWRTVITTPEWESITYAPWITADYKFIWTWKFDPVLWYDPSLRDLYQKVNSWEFKAKWVLEDYANMKWRTLDELWNEATNYQTAVDNELDKYSDVDRKVSRDRWFAVNSKAVYSDIWDALWKKAWILSDKEWLNYAKQVWIDTTNEAKAIETIRKEYDNYNKWYNETMQDESMYRLINSLEYIIMQDASYIQRKNIMNNVWEWNQIDLKWLWGEEADWAVAYNYIMADEIFKKLTNTKAAWATLYPVSDADMKMVRDASTILNWNASDDNFKRQINKMYKDIREYVWKPISNTELADMWNKEGEMLFLWDYFQNPDFSNYLTIDHARYSWLLWGYNYWHKNTQQKVEYNWVWDIGNEKKNVNENTDSFSDEIMGDIWDNG